jgi:hypothetical protein
MIPGWRNIDLGEEIKEKGGMVSFIPLWQVLIIIYRVSNSLGE